MNYLNIELPKVPDNIHNLQNFKDFLELITYVSEVNKNVNKYAEAIVYGEFLKRKNQWQEILSEKDFEPIKNITTRYHGINLKNKNPNFLYCNITNKFFLFEANHHAPSTGYGGDKHKFKFDVKNYLITLELISSTASSRPQGRCNGYETIKTKKFTINLISKIITQIK